MSVKPGVAWKQAEMASVLKLQPAEFAFVNQKIRLRRPHPSELWTSDELPWDVVQSPGSGEQGATPVAEPDVPAAVGAGVEQAVPHSEVEHAASQEASGVAEPEPTVHESEPEAEQPADQIPCPNADKGCDYAGSQKGVYAHLRFCKFKEQ